MQACRPCRGPAAESHRPASILATKQSPSSNCYSLTRQQVIGISHSLGQHPCRWVVFFSSFLVCIWSKLLLKSHLAAAHRRRSPPRPAWGRGAQPPPRWLHSRRSSAPTGKAGVSAAGAGPWERHGRELLSRRAAPGRRVPGMCRLADVSCGSSAAEQAEQASCYMMQPPSTVFRLKRRLPPKGFWRPRAQAGGPPKLGTHTGRALAHHKGSSLQCDTLTRAVHSQ